MRHVLCTRLTCMDIKRNFYISFIFVCFFHTGNSFVVSHIKRTKVLRKVLFHFFLFPFLLQICIIASRISYLFVHSNQYIQHKRKSTTNKKTYRYTKNVLEVEEFLSIEKHFPVKRINIIRSGV